MMADAMDSHTFSCSCGTQGPENFLQLHEGGTLVLWQCTKCWQAYNGSGELLVHSPETSGNESVTATAVSVDPCHTCGNEHPEAFVVTECKGSKDIVLQCLTCDGIQSTIKHQPNPVHYLNVGVSCVHCSNQDEDLFEGTLEDEQGVVKIRCLICDYAYEESTAPMLSCECCQNTDTKRFEVTKNSQDKLISIECQECGGTVAIDNEAHPLPKRVLAAIPARMVITCGKELHMGDHIELHRKWGYKHHALVIKYSTISKKVKVIHYSGELNDKKDAEVREEWIDFPDDPVYCIQYHPRDCFKPTEVIRRAQSRLGESSYNFFTHNCEHFARWAKAGSSTSHQVCELFTKGAQTMIQSCSERAVAMVTAGEVGEMMAGKKGLTKFDAASSALIFGFKALNTCKKVMGAKRLFDAGNTTKQVFHENCVEMVTKDSIEAFGTMGGSLVGQRVGHFIGQMVVPMPLLGAVIGATLGSLIGQVIGTPIGKLACDLYREASRENAK